MPRILITFLFCIFLTMNIHAQYRCIPHIDEYGNPSEYVDEDLYASGVIFAMYQQLNPVWSAVYPIGFPFVFNGDSVTHFKVSSTGVVTFDTTATVAPPFGAVTLPDAMIPDKSVCVTGIKASGTNSKVIILSEPLYGIYISTKRKWIMFSQFSDTVGNQFAYPVSWFVVLEENSNKIYFVDAYKHPLSSISVSAGIQIDNTTAYMVPGSPAVPSLSGSSWYDDDNVYYEFSPGNDLQTDGALIATSLYPYQDIADAPYTIPIKFRNFGTDTVNTVTLTYSVNGVLQQTQTFNGLNIPCGNSQVFNFTNQLNPATSGTYSILVEAVNVNNNTDADLSNNQFQFDVFVAPTLPPRRALFEQSKGIWCTYCGYWTVKYDSILALNRVKASDLKLEQGGYNLAWSQTEVNNRIHFYNTLSFPSAYANGKLAISDVYNYWEGCPWHVDQNMIDSLYNLKGLFYIQPTFTTNGYHGEISATITSTVQFQSSARCKIHVAILQDTIVTPPQGASNESLFVNTMLKMFPDAGGTYIGSPALGQIDTVNFSFLITDTSTIVSRLRLVVFVQDSITKEVFQVAEVPVVNNCTPVYATTFHDICIGDSVNIDGVWYNNNVELSQILTGSNGCDSLHVDFVIRHFGFVHITMNSINIYANNINLYPNSDSVATYAWYDLTNNQFVAGANQYSLIPPHPGMYALLVTNQFGCQTWSNTVNFQCSPSSLQQSFTICNGDSIQVNTSWYTLPGIYADTLNNASGCDSIITTTLMVNYPDTNLVVNNNVFIANSGSIFYEWIDCISGNILSSGTIDTLFTATTTGWYQLQVTDSSGCTFTSACYPVYFTGLSTPPNPDFVLMPNPASTFVQLILKQPVSDAIVRIYDTKGKLISEKQIQQQSTRIETSSLANGIYSVVITGTNFTGRFQKLIINK